VPWHDAPLAPCQTLADVVVGLLVPKVRRSLPPAWRGPYGHDRARAWIVERDAEGAVLMVTEVAAKVPAGLVILGEEAAVDGPSTVDVRVGYLLAPACWGRGLATELIGGLVAWCRRQGQIRALTGGVARDNPASARVLTNNGFALIDTTADGEQIHQLVL